MKILLTGAQGQLGRSLSGLADQGGLPQGWVLQGMARQALDITDADAVNAVCRRWRPDAVINAAAWTAVDKAEEQGDQAMAVNALGAANVAAAAAACGARLLHVSTDYVFDGTANAPMDETVTPNPVNVYGASKWAGERAVFCEHPAALVIRTSWLYSQYGDNFVRTMLGLGAQRAILDVVSDQIACPTWAGDLAQVLVQLLQRPAAQAGVYHYAGSQAISWHAFAQQIFHYAAQHGPGWNKVRVRPVTSAAYGARAVRPLYTALDSGRLGALGMAAYAPRQRLEAVVASILACRQSRP